MEHNRKHSLRSKGQDIIEYALMLAIVVGIGFLVYNQSNMADKINAVFGNANNLLATVEKKAIRLSSTTGIMRTPWRKC